MEKGRNEVIFHTSKTVVVTCWIVLSIFAIAFIVYLTGGTEYPFTHFMYIPIAIAGYCFGVRASVIVAIIGGVLLGPFMPKNVSLGVMQDPGSWLFRTGMFLIVGIVIGLLFQRIKTYEKIQKEKSFNSEFTGLPNVYKLKTDLNEMIDKKMFFSLAVFRIENLESINRYVDYSIGEKSIFKVIEVLEDFFGKDNIYFIYNNKLAVVMSECSIEDISIKGMEFLNIFNEPIPIDEFLVDIVIKGGVVNYPLHGEDSIDLIKKMDIALDGKSNLSIYDISIEKQNKQKYELIVALYKALENDEFHIVYQPKISLRENKVMGLEALIRWNRGNKEAVNPGEFIKIAESIGIISEITKWVIKTTINQLEEWQEEGIQTKVAINISSKDLKNHSVMEYTKRCIQDSKIDPTMLEFELTERGLIENENRAKLLLDNAREFGIKISMDDFGTGYNSLIDLIRFPIDHLKIDKLFIDKIEDDNNNALVENIIHIAHDLEMEVIAEGVESKEQVQRLEKMGCDHIQGYYFSKPLPPEKIKEFIFKFDISA